MLSVIPGNQRKTKGSEDKKKNKRQCLLLLAGSSAEERLFSGSAFSLTGGKESFNFAFPAPGTSVCFCPVTAQAGNEDTAGRREKGREFQEKERAEFLVRNPPRNHMAGFFTALLSELLLRHFRHKNIEDHSLTSSFSEKKVLPHSTQDDHDGASVHESFVVGAGQ